MLVDIEDRDDVVVARQPGRGERLSLEPFAQLRVLGEAFGQHLDRHLAAEHVVRGQEDFPHPAMCDGARVPVAGRE